MARRAFILDKIESIYDNYNEVVNYFTKEVIANRIEQISDEMIDFLGQNNLQEIAYVNVVILTHAIMDYFSDVKRLKDYQHIERVNNYKIKGYETFWLLQRKPIQIKDQLEDDKWAFINEKFLVTRICSFLYKRNYPLSRDRARVFKSFSDTLLYYLKFRKCDAQALELMLMSFVTGEVIGEAVGKRKGETLIIPEDSVMY